MMSGLIFLLTVGLVVALHEFGHFAAMKAFGVPVKEFSVGIGPRIFGFERWNTKWSFRAFLIGGYNSADGEVMNAKPVWQRMLIFLAGVFVNFLMIVLMGSLLGVVGPLLRLLPGAFLETIHAIVGVFVGAKDQLTGPVGLMKDMSHQPHHSFLRGMYVDFVVNFITLNMGLLIFNLIPLPMLDGGRVVMLAFEPIVGRKIMAKIEPFGIAISVLILLALYVLTTIADFRR